MPVEFLSDAEAAGFGRYQGPPSQDDLDRLFFLDDADRVLVSKRRGDHMRLGFASQLVTVRYLGSFLVDALDVPHVVVEYLADQLGVDDPSCLKLYGERPQTRLEHTWEIQEALGLVDFASASAELESWIRARSWTTGDGPKLIFNDAETWLRSRSVLLPGVSVLARLVASARDATTTRLHDAIAGRLTDRQRESIDGLLVVRDGERVCDLERLRRSPLTVSGPGMVRALARIRELADLSVPDLADIPARRLTELSRYGLSGKPASLRRHPPARRHATLAASVRFSEQKAIDDALELLDLLVANELVGTAVRVADKEMLRTHARLTEAARSLRSAVRVLLDGINQPERPTLDELWASISEVVPVGALEQAVATIESLTPAGEGSKQDWRAVLSARRIVTVSGFLSILTEVIDFDADLESQPILDAMLTIPDLLGQWRSLTVDDIDETIVPAAWSPAVLGAAGRSDAGFDKNSYVFCVLVEFQRHLKRRGIYAPRSTRWTDPRVSLLDGDQWEASKDVVLTALALPSDPAGMLGEHRTALDDAYRRVAAHLDDTGSDLSVDDAGRVHLASLAAVPEPESLVLLRRMVAAMLPRVDLSQIVLEVIGWEPGFVEASDHGPAATPASTASTSASERVSSHRQ